MKNIITFGVYLLFSLNLIYAGCGACNVSKKSSELPKGEFIGAVPEDGSISGLVLTSCGMCNFGMKEKKDCSLAIQINEQSYSVEGTGMEDHGDSHADDGFCNAVRVASVTGIVKDNVFTAKTFALQKN